VLISVYWLPLLIAICSLLPVYDIGLTLDQEAAYSGTGGDGTFDYKGIVVPHVSGSGGWGTRTRWASSRTGSSTGLSCPRTGKEYNIVSFFLRVLSLSVRDFLGIK